MRVIENRYAAYFKDQPDVPFAVRDGNGSARVFGSGEPAFTLIARNTRGVSALASLDLFDIATSYVEGDIDYEGDFLAAVGIRDFFSDKHPFKHAWRYARPLVVGQVKSDKHWIAQHYDYDQEFYLMFLDRRHRCYSQAIYAHDDEPLEDAISRKLDFAIDAIGAKAGDRVLDIGGGWGAFTEHAGKRGIRVTSLTISKESEKFLKSLIARDNLPCEVRLEHFFEHQPHERYDGIVNLGVTEHLPDYRASMQKYMSLLKPGAKLYLDASATRKKGGHSAFMEKYIYPGNGSLMCLHEYLAEVARSPLHLRGVWDDTHSYYLTLRAWARNLDSHASEIEERWGKQLFRKFQLWLWRAADGTSRDRSQGYRVVLQAPA